MDTILSSPHELEQSSKQNKKAMLFNLIVLLIIFIAVTFIFPNGSQRNLFAWEDSQLLITCPDDSAYAVPYESLTHILLIEDADLGTCLSGEQGSSYCYGIWENETLGTYVLCAYKSFSTLIQLTTEGETYWISYESPETTRGLYSSIVETLTQEGYSFVTTP